MKPVPSVLTAFVSHTIVLVDIHLQLISLDKAFDAATTACFKRPESIIDCNESISVTTHAL